MPRWLLMKTGELGPLNPYWPAHFPWTLCVCLCVCVCVYVWCNVGDQHCYELVSSGPHVLFGAEPAQSAAVTRSPGADFTLREEVLVYSFWTSFLTSLLFRLSDPVIEVTLVQKLLRSLTGCHRVVFSFILHRDENIGGGHWRVCNLIISRWRLKEKPKNHHFHSVHRRGQKHSRVTSTQVSAVFSLVVT